MFKSSQEREAARAEREAERAREQAALAESAAIPVPVTGETSTARVFASGDATVVSGVTVGVYLFRNTSLPEPAD